LYLDLPLRLPRCSRGDCRNAEVATRLH